MSAFRWIRKIGVDGFTNEDPDSPDWEECTESCLGAQAVKPLDDSDKLHYYLINFTYENGSASLRIGYPDQCFSEARIEMARESLGLPSNSTPVAVSYLGYATPEEFRS